jgi:hypothetical protein
MSTKPYKQGLEIELVDKIDWPHALKQRRYAGGHDDVLSELFGGNTEIAHWNEGDYQGQVATAHWLEGIGCVVMTDYYGSCSGCDAWEDSTDDDARKMIIDLVNGAYVFPSRISAIEWINTIDSERDPHTYAKEAAKNLKIPLKEEVQ